MSLRNEGDLDRILHFTDVDHIPAEFVRAARIIDFEGESKTITPEELEEIMSNQTTLSEMGIQDIRLILDLEIVKRTIRSHSELVLCSIPE
jgi:hypothetical protein